MSSRVYLSRDNFAESATITCADSSNEELLASRSTGRAMVTSSVASTSITLDWGGSEVVLSSFALHQHNGRLATSPTWRIRLYDHQVPASGNVVADSGTLTAATAYASNGQFSEPEKAQSLYTFTTVSSGRLVPDQITAKSVVLDLATSDAFAWEVGYLWAGLSVGLSARASLGPEDEPASSSNARATETQGAAVAFAEEVRTIERDLNLPLINADDKETLLQVFRGVGGTSPFFLHLADGSPRDPSSEGGVLRFVDKGLKFKSIGAHRGRADDLYSLRTAVTRWR